MPGSIRAGSSTRNPAGNSARPASSRIAAGEPACRVRRLAAMMLTLLTVAAVTLSTSPRADSISDDEIAIESLPNPRDSGPDASLSPGVVVRLQMMALGQNDIWGENAGIATAFRFASPTNRSFTGPLERFIQLLNNPQYRPMLGYQSIEYAPTRIRDNEAMVPVLLTMADQQQFGYLFVLSRSTDDACTCWMTDRVTRVYVNPDEQSREPI